MNTDTTDIAKVFFRHITYDDNGREIVKEDV